LTGVVLATARSQQLWLQHEHHRVHQNFGQLKEPIAPLSRCVQETGLVLLRGTPVHFCGTVAMDDPHRGRETPEGLWPRVTHAAGGPCPGRCLSPRQALQEVATAAFLPDGAI